MKKADQDTINKMEARLNRDPSFASVAQLSLVEAAQQMVMARGSTSGGAFSADGRAIAAIGDVEETFRDDLAKFDDKAQEEEGGEGSEAAKEEGKVISPMKGKQVRRVPLFRHTPSTNRTS